MKRNFTDRATVNRRVVIGASCITLLLLILLARVSYIMIFKNSEYSKMAVEQWTSDVKIAAKRGKILDSKGEELAVSGNVYRVDLDLKTIARYNKNHGTTNSDLAKPLAEALEMEEELVLKKLNYRLPSGAPAQSSILARRVEKEKSDKVKELNIDGVMVSADTKRYYPNNEFLCHVLGNTNSDGKGLTGIELVYDSVLAGTPGVRITEIAKEGDTAPDIISNFKPPVDGKDVILTIDSTIQGFLEKAANKALEENKADNVSIIATNPMTGEILGMVNTPGFNPNKPYEGFEKFDGETDREKVQKMWRNRAVSDTFEPGSIFKVITATAAMEEGVANKGEKYNCGGSMSVGGRTIHCWKRTGHGELTFSQIVENSCNVGFMTIGQKLGPEKLTEYIKRYGLGSKSGVDLPGEASGIIKKTEKITETDLATISFGQTNTVNMIQYMTAFNAVANGGKLIQPHVMKEITYVGEDGQRVIDKEFEPKIKEGIISEKTATEFRDILKTTVVEGGSHNSYIKGFDIGGKTGTAQKVKPTGGYGGGYVASYIAMAPTGEPKITIFVSIDNPTAGAYYGGQIAAPVGKEVFEDLFNYLGAEYFGGSLNDTSDDVIIPEVRGLSVIEAKKIIKEAGLKCKIEGEDEYISDMMPKAGYSVNTNSEIKLYTGGSSNYNKDVIVPSFIGFSKEMVESMIDKIGLTAKFEGDGIVKEQSIKEGSVTRKGETITFKLNVD